MAFGTAGEVIADAAGELGLGTYDPATFDPWASSDPNIMQMIALLKSAGRYLVHERDWTYLRGEHTFNTVAGQAAYDFPVGMINMIDQTYWVRSTRLPMGGPLSPQEWQYLKARLVGVTLTLLFRPMNKQMYIFPDTNTPGGLEVAFEYQSGNWVMPAGVYTGTNPYYVDSIGWAPGQVVSVGDVQTVGVTGLGRFVALTAGVVSSGATTPNVVLLGLVGSEGATGVTDGITFMYTALPGAKAPQIMSDAPSARTDELWFDSLLLSRRLKLEFLKAKGFDTTAALQDYKHAFELISNSDTQAPILSMSKRSFGALMGERNVPVTGFGTP